MSDKYLDTVVVNRGNQKRLKNVMLRARGGEAVTIGYPDYYTHLRTHETPDHII